MLLPSNYFNSHERLRTLLERHDISDLLCLQFYTIANVHCDNFVAFVIINLVSGWALQIVS